MGSEISKLPLNKLSYADISVGEEFSFERTVSEKDVLEFSGLSGDRSSLHMDEAYAAATKFGHRVVHGMLLASFFSALVGMLCPGEKCVYLSQDIKFKKPLAIGGAVKISGTVTDKSDATRILTIRTLVSGAQGEVLVEGEAKVQVYEPAS